MGDIRMGVPGMPVAQRPKKGYKMANKEFTLQFMFHKWGDGSASCAVHLLDSMNGDIKSEASPEQILAAFMELANVARISVEKGLPDKPRQRRFAWFLYNVIKWGDIMLAAPKTTV